MEMEQRLGEMMERLFARQSEEMTKMKANINAEADARLESTLAFLRGLSSSEEGMTTICQVPPVVCPEKSKAGPERMEDAIVTFEESSGKIEAELRKGEMNVDNIESLEDRYGDRRLVVRRRRGAKKRIQDSVGSRQKSALRKRLVCRAIPAMLKGNIRRASCRDSIRRGNQKVRIFGKQQRTRSEYNKGINCRGARQQTRQRMRRTSNRKARKTTGLVRSADRLREENSGTFWKIRSPTKRKISSPA
jgi:hypothetical protein